MGRGRAKAKQTKVARQLKYNTQDMDPDSLLKELASRKPEPVWTNDEGRDSDPWADDNSR
ncbi:DUF3073 domain-containing protein [Corynebacterium doosanense]|uniref:DUF3073 domain-containing protein n=1 Tax=Corynebacterium doosanense CAU 212 = DSM 45436 TaxID=558173 RepID=A0A097II32_9CORY|nr:DUF3073 domain-containing protein [Corynebacterium doosanense]AIT61783.1 hypothetical protein CDOO_11295 [Corynebacterium doosanense CAU 212 = DSM 45436]